MPKPIDFKGSNRILTAPKGQEDTCSDLPVYSDGEKFTLSCWEFTDDEILEIYKNKKLWVWIYAGGKTQPPIALDTLDPREEKDG